MAKRPIDFTLAIFLLAATGLPAHAAPQTDLIKGFYFTSYGSTEFNNSANTKRLGDYREQIPNATHAIAAVHVRVPGGIHSNTVARDDISENPEDLSGWFDNAKSHGLRVGLIIILFSDNGWNWGGLWDPSNPSEALNSYYTTIQPYLAQAEKAAADFVIIADEWSTLFIKQSSIEPFKALVKNVRKDYNAGWICININKLEEASILPEIASLMDVIGVTAYVQLSNNSSPTYNEMFNNLVKPSSVPSVKEAVNDARQTTLGRNDQAGYMAFIREMSTKWGKPVMLTTGYKSTTGAAKNPADQPTSSPDNQIQADAWKAFITAALDPEHGAGLALAGILGWRLWPAAEDDDGVTGFTVIDKPAAVVINKAWGDNSKSTNSVPVASNDPSNDQYPKQEQTQGSDNVIAYQNQDPSLWIAVLTCLDAPENTFHSCVRDSFARH